MTRLLDRLGTAERVGLALLVAWVLWAGIAGLLNGRVLSLTSPYVVAPVFLVLGVAFGRLVAARLDGARGDGFWVDVGLVAAVALFWARNPTAYLNANAAVAVQLMALTGLALLGAPARRRLLLVVTVLAAFGLVFANQSKAGVAVVVPVLATVALVLARRPRRRRWAVAGGVVALVGAGVGNVVLTRRDDWPGWGLDALDPVRHRLWQDALELWRRRPVVGNGPGSFREFSPLALDPDTATAHSSLLQVGSETGVVGVVLLFALAVAGIAVAARGPAPYAVLAVAAWTALGVHSVADHLLEFPAVMLAAGTVLGWAAAARQPSPMRAMEA